MSRRRQTNTDALSTTENPSALLRDTPGECAADRRVTVDHGRGALDGLPQPLNRPVPTVRRVVVEQRFELLGRGPCLPHELRPG